MLRYLSSAKGLFCAKLRRVRNCNVNSLFSTRQLAIKMTTREITMCLSDCTTCQWSFHEAYHVAYYWVESWRKPLLPKNWFCNHQIHKLRLQTHSYIDWSNTSIYILFVVLSGNTAVKYPTCSGFESLNNSRLYVFSDSCFQCYFQVPKERFLTKFKIFLMDRLFCLSL